MVEKVGLGSNAGRRARRRGSGRSLFPTIRSFAAAIAAVMLAVPAIPGRAQTSFTFVPGITVITGFSGTKLATDRIEAGVDPIDRTFIDPDGPALRIFDVSILGGPPAGQLINAPVHLDVPARQIGQVFGLAFDGGVDGTQPNLYAAATSAFGLSIVGAGRAADGSPVRLKSGAPDASFMEGQFGALSKSSPSAIYKVDGATGSLSYVADTAFAGASNSGPGIGGLAYDAASKSLYASDLDSGVVHRFGLDYNYADLSQYDHGVAGRHAAGLAEVGDDGQRAVITDPAFKADDPATWGFTQPQRRVDALAVHDGRLYYAVAEGPEIWSVGLRGGDFLDDARREVTIKAEKPFPVTGIAFDGSGRMIVAQRGPVKSPYDYGSFADTGAQVLRYAPESPDDPSTPDLWKSDPASYAVGTADDSNAGSGGVSLQYGYKPDGTVDFNTCDATVAITGDTLTATASGVQLNSLELVRPANVPPTQSAFIDYDARQEDPDVRGHVGNVAAVRLCDAAGGFPPVEDGSGGGGGTFPPVDEGGGGGGGTFPPVDEGGGGGTTFPEVEDGDGTESLVVAKTASVDKCSPKGGCAFNISVSNPTATELPGPIVINDQIDAPQAALTGEPNAPWTCSKAAPFSCTHPGPVPANGALDDLRMVFAPNTAADVKEVKNCAALSGAAPAAQIPVDKAALPPPPAPTTSNNGGLTVEKRGIPATCNPAAGTCEFEVKITNNTGQPINQQPLKIFDTMSVGTQTQAKNELNAQQLPAGLRCTPQGREFNCSQDALTLAPNASLSFKASFKIDTSEGGQAAFVTNKAIVALGPLTGEATASIPFDEAVNVELPEPVDAGQVANAGGEAQDAQSCATIPLDPNVPVQTGPIITAKKGPAKCTANGPCTFTISVTNNTEAEIKGPIAIDEQIDAPLAALAGDPNAPWTCTKAAPFTCTHPGPLAAKKSVDLIVSFTPNTPPETKELKNCAVPKQAGNGADPNDKKKFAPGKKSELQPFRPFYFKSLIEPAAFRSQSFASDKGLLHLVGNAGGTIGGGAPNKCIKFKFPSAFSVRQSNDVAITLDNASANVGGQALGRARIFGGKSGAFDGTLDGKNFRFVITWSDGTQSTYLGSIDENGQLSGLTRNGTTGETLRFNGLQPWKCAVDQLCQDYATEAVAARKEAHEKFCFVEGARWSPDVNEHLSWCMAQTRAGGSPIPLETDGRNTTLDKCRKTFSTCSDFSKAMMERATEIKRLNCKEPLALPPEGLINNCMQNPASLDDRTTAAQKSLDACKAQLAADGAQDGVADGGAQGGGAGAEPAPEQCAVVQLEDEQPQPGGGGVVGGVNGNPADQGNGLTVQKFALKSPCVKGSNCDFKVLITGKSPAADGSVSIVDTPENAAALDMPQAGALTVPPAAPWKCEAGLPLRCTHPGPMPAEGLVMTFSLRPGEKAEAQSVRNCVASDANAPGQDAAPEPSCVDVPLQGPGPAAGQLALAKNPVASQCSATGGGCVFMISITNPAGAPEFNGPITVADHISAPDGSPFPNLTMDTPVNAIQPEGVVGNIGCTKDGSDVTCTSAAMKIPPGKTIQLPMTFTPGNGSVATAIKNCASFAGGEQQCATIPLTNGPLLRANKLTGSKTCVPECAFGIMLTNVGNSAATGPFVLSEDFSPMGPGVKIEVVDGDFACNQVGAKVGCISTNKKTNVLRPGESTSGRVKISGAELSPQYKNCISYDPNAQAKPSPFDNDWPGRCVTINEADPNRPKLDIFKAAQGLGCKVDGPCRYEIIVSNFGTGYSGPIEILDEVPTVSSAGKQQPQPAHIEPLPNADWSCTKLDPRRMSCTANKQSLAGGGANISLPVLVTPGPGWKKNDVVENCGTLKAANGTIGDGKRACAQHTLDPFNVKVSKTGDQSCKPGGDCHFTINLFNPGPIDHNAPVTISDRLNGLSSAQILSIKPPLPCATQPTQIPFSCTSPGAVCLEMDGKPGDKCGPRTFEMVVRLPNDASAAQFSNCASVGGENLAGDDPVACHPVKLAPPEPFSLKIDKTGPATCEPGSECAFDLTITNTGRKDHSGAVTLIDGLSGSPAMTIVSVEPPLPCEQPSTIPFNCRSADDFTLPSGGTRKFRVTARVPRSAGTTFNNCAILERAKAHEAEPLRSGESTDSSLWSCITVRTAEKPAPPAEKPQCKGGMVLLDGGMCACPPGTSWNGRACAELSRAEPPRKIPPVVQPRDEPQGGTQGTKPGGDEGCPRGTHFERGACRRDVTPVCEGDRPVGTFPNCCPRGMHFERGACRPDRVNTGKPDGGTQGTKPSRDDRPKCPPGTIGRYPRCRCPQGMTGTPPNCCPPGTRYQNGVCIRPQPTGPGNDGASGTKPCPPGTHATRSGQCVENPAPTQKPPPTPSKTEPSTGKCTRGRVGTPPNCHCPPGTRFMRGRCLSPAPAPTPTGPTPTPRPKCPSNQPFGSPPNCCDADHWNSKTKGCERVQGPR